MANPMAPPGPTGGGTTIQNPGPIQGPFNGPDSGEGGYLTDIPPGYVQMPGYPGYFYNPQTGDIRLATGYGDNGQMTTRSLSSAEKRAFLASLGLTGDGTSGGGGGGGFAPEYTDPRYWQLQYDQLTAQLTNAGLDAESARKQALATLITSRNAQQVNLAGEQANAAAKAAEFAANPRDAVAELMYRNAIGNATPFGDTSNPQFADYKSALQDKFQALFGPTAGAFEQAQLNLNAPIPSDFTSPSYTGPGSQFLNNAPVATDPLAAYGGSPLVDAFRKSGMSIDDFIKGLNAKQFAAGGQIKVGDMTRYGGYQPSSSEGGTNMNIHEPSAVVGMHSGHVYATLAEGGYPEQLKIMPTPSGKKAAQEVEKAGKSMQMMPGARPMATGGTISAGSDPSQFLMELQKNLARLSSPGGGIGAAGAGEKGLPSLRFLAGDPYSRLQQDPDLLNYALAGYSSQGISPANVLATIEKFTPTGVQNNFPRIVF